LRCGTVVVGGERKRSPRASDFGFTRGARAWSELLLATVLLPRASPSLKEKRGFSRARDVAFKSREESLAKGPDPRKRCGARVRSSRGTLSAHETLGRSPWKGRTAYAP